VHALKGTAGGNGRLLARSPRTMHLETFCFPVIAGLGNDRKCFPTAEKLTSQQKQHPTKLISDVLYNVMERQRCLGAETLWGSHQVASVDSMDSIK
jgi:hypothetical protein